MAAGAAASTLTAEELSAVRADIEALFAETPCQPLIVRLAWHDAGTYDKETKTGGANGTIRFAELAHGANNGLSKALEIVAPIKAKHPKMSFADFIQYASMVAIEVCGGPKVTEAFRQGRVDAEAEKSTPDGRLPDAGKASSHLRDIFYRMGFNDREIVALSGAHALGGAHKDRSGFEGNWTSDRIKFDNEYFRNLLNPADGLLVLPSDRALVEDDKMRPIVEEYAADQAKFFSDYVAAHKKLSELGME